MLEKIVSHTNQKLKDLRVEYARDRDCVDISVEEIRALFGLLYLGGLLKMSHTHVTDLWATDGTAPDYFRSVMRSNRFLLLLRALRFENSDNREERKKVDKLAPIRDVWKTINNKFSEFYVLN